MTHEEMQRTMEFIVQQQAQFAVNIQLLQEERMRDSARIAGLEESFPLLVQLAQTTDSRSDKPESSAAASEANIAAIGEAKEHAEERLSALINTVREQRNGRSS
jgi:hypothetical protein